LYLHSLFKQKPITTFSFIFVTAFSGFLQISISVPPLRRTAVTAALVKETVLTFTAAFVLQDSPERDAIKASVFSCNK